MWWFASRREDRRRFRRRAVRCARARSLANRAATRAPSRRVARWKIARLEIDPIIQIAGVRRVDGGRRRGEQIAVGACDSLKDVAAGTVRRRCGRPQRLHDDGAAALIRHGTCAGCMPDGRELDVIQVMRLERFVSQVEPQDSIGIGLDA